MQKSLFTFILVLTAVAVTFAQTEKGRWTVGAQVGNFSYNTQYGYRTFTGSMSPSAGYFLATNLVVGTGMPLSLGMSSSKNNQVHSQSSSIGLSPFVRYYFGETKLKPYVGASYAYSVRNQKTDNPSRRENYRGFASELSPTIGVAYFINRTVALNAGLSYLYGRYDNGNPNYDVNGNLIKSTTSTQNYLTLNVGFHLFLGK